MSIDMLTRHDVIVQSPTNSCQDAAALMRARNVGCVVIVRDEEPVGIITDRDLVTRVMALGRDPARVLLQEVMSPSPIFVSHNRNLSEVIETMRELGVRRLPVVDAQNRLKGIIAADDVLMHLSHALGALGQAIQRELRSSPDA
jgi:CBS domain-containing protein